MQIAAEVRRVLSRKPRSIKLEHFKLKFKKRRQTTEKDDKEAIEAVKRQVIGTMGVPVKRV